MKTDANFIVIGCGFSGSILARYIAEELDQKVEIWERRAHIAGNMYDYIDEHGINVHQYGPHTFHTNDIKIVKYINKFSKWNPYILRCGAIINNQFSPTPFNFETIDLFFDKEKAEKIKENLKQFFSNRKSVPILELLNHSNNLIHEYAEFLFENDYKPYSAKQWGIPPERIDKSIFKRVPVNLSYDNSYFDDTYQLLPEKGYENFFKNLLNHKNISVHLNIEAKDYIKINSDSNKILIENNVTNKKIIYTGALDELFNGVYGYLPYRSLKFLWKFEDIDSFQNEAVVAYPQEEAFTRITEYKKLPIQKVEGTSYALEYPLEYKPNTGMEPYYPLLTKESKYKYKKYKMLADSIENLIYCGRLADFKYYNMDQIIARALHICETRLSSFIIND